MTNQNWDQYGYNQFMTHNLQGDPNYQTTDDYNADVQDGSITNAKIKSLTATKITAGILQSSDEKTYFDLDNDILIINDGSNDIVLLGLDSGGF